MYAVLYWFTCSIDIFFFNDTATTEIYTLSLHDALPISSPSSGWRFSSAVNQARSPSKLAPLNLGTHRSDTGSTVDRKSTRLNSSHANISYAVFCLKKKKTNTIIVQHSQPS